MIRDEYQKKIINPKTLENKLSDLEFRTIRNKIRDYINKTQSEELLKEICKSCITHGMKI